MLSLDVLWVGKINPHPWKLEWTEWWKWNNMLNFSNNKFLNKMRFLYLRSTWTVRSQVGTPPFQMQMFTLYWRPSKILLAAECNIDQYSPPLMAPITTDSRYLCEELKRLMTHSDEFFHFWKVNKYMKMHLPLAPTI